MGKNEHTSITAAVIIQLLEQSTDDRRPLKSKLQREAPVKELVEALRMSNTVLTRRILCDILGARRAKTAVPALLGCLDQPDSKLKNDAAEALAKIGSGKAGPELLKHFTDDPRYWYAIALGDIGYRPAIPYLMDALSSSNPDVREGSAWSLGFLKAMEAKDRLTNALSIETDNFAKARIKDALEILNKLEK